MINPNAPDKYKYEMDYRKIPREYLNARIPKRAEWSSGKLSRRFLNNMKY